MEEIEIKLLIENINDLAETQEKILIKNIIHPLHPADLAEVIHHLSKENRELIFSLLDVEMASQVVSELDNYSRDLILEDLEISRISEIAEEMDSDDATDLLSLLSDERAQRVLDRMPKEDSAEVKELLKHPEETAGGIMAKEFISVEQNHKVEEAIQVIRSKAEEVEVVYYVFVVDKLGVLVGILSLKKLILATPGTIISEIMYTEVISVKTALDQEEVANIAKKYDLISIPVVDEKSVLVGRITIDDVIDVLEEEVSEDIHKMAGITEEKETGETSSIKISRVRLPWLITGLAGGIIAALIMNWYEQSLENIIALSFFTPVMMSMGGNIGIQSSTIIVRGLATGEISVFDAYKHLFKEVKVALLNGFICSLLFSIIAGIWLNIKLGILIGISLFLIMNVAAIIGGIAPLVLKKLNIDPAIATGPFITISNDLFGLLIYFSLTSYVITN